MVSERAAFVGKGRHHRPRNGRLVRKEQQGVWTTPQKSHVILEEECDEDSNRKTSLREKEP